MGTRSRNWIKALITKDILNIRCLGVKKSVNDHFGDTLDSLHSSIAQTPQPGPSTSTMLKVLKSRAKREASRKAAINIKKQQSISLIVTGITRTKTREQNTRAIAQTKALKNANIAEEAIVYKLAQKSHLAKQMQKRQRQERKKQRIAQLQRAQEKEERRKEEEQQRLQRLQEQERAKGILTEQRRREQEAERRKERAQRHAVVEVMKSIRCLHHRQNMAPNGMVELHAFWIVNLTTMNQMMN